MFIHIFAFHWKDSASQQQKQAAIHDIMAFEGTISGLVHLWIGDNRAQGSAQYTTTGTMIFSSELAYQNYTSHALHRDLLTWLVPLIEAIEFDYQPVTLQ